MIVYIFEPFFNYYFTNSYMAYGYSTILPAFFAIYGYFLIRKNPADILFLILGFLAIFIYGNRACLLSIIFMMILTSKLLIRAIKRIYNKKVRINKSKTIKNIIIILILFVVSFGVNYSIIIGIPNLIYSQKLSESTNISNNIENRPPKKELTFKSYSILKYEKILDGQYNTIMSGRLEIYSDAIKVIQKTYSLDIIRSLFGNGTGYYRSLNDGTYTHCIIFDVMIEYGIVGLIVMGGLFLFYFFKWLKNAKKDKFLFGAYLVCLAFPRLLISLFFQKEMNLFLFIVFVATYFPMNGNIKHKRKLLEKQ